MAPAPAPALEDAKSKDFYGVLGLKKEECTTAEIRNAYKMLAMKWHPDRCSRSGHVKQAEEEKKKFQAIQNAYSVLSDLKKRFLYDIGLYDNEDEEDENGMRDFVDEMVDMMCQNKPSENTKESFEELQELFEDIFQTDIDAFGSSSSSSFGSAYSSTFTQTCDEHYNDNKNKRDYSQISLNSSMNETSTFHEFHFGVEGGHEEYSNSRRKRDLETRSHG